MNEVRGSPWFYSWLVEGGPDGEAVLVNDGYQVGIGWKWLELVGPLRDTGSDWEWTKMVGC